MTPEPQNNIPIAAPDATPAPATPQAGPINETIDYQAIADAHRDEQNALPVNLEPSDDTKQNIADGVKFAWRAVSQVANTSAFEPISGWLNKQNEGLSQLVFNESVHNHPMRSELAQGYLTVQEGVEKLLMGMSTPANTALILSGNSESALSDALASSPKAVLTLKAAQHASNIYFGWRGAESLMTGKQPGETESDYRQRQAFAVAQILFASAGTAANIKDSVHARIQRSLGISGNLAAKVDEKFQQADALNTEGQFNAGVAKAGSEARVASLNEASQIILADKTKKLAALQKEANETKFNSAAERAAFHKETARRIADLERDIEAQKAALEKAMPPNVNRIKGLAKQAILEEKARVSKLYGAAKAFAKGPVTSVADLRAELVNAFSDSGVHSEDIPSSVLERLPGERASNRLPTRSEEQAGRLVAQLRKDGLGAGDIRSALLNLGYGSNQITLIMRMAGVVEPDGVSFDTLLDIKRDLWDGLQKEQRKANPDPGLVNGFMSARNTVERLASHYAVERNFGESNKTVTLDGRPIVINKMWNDANYEYMRFSRELGVGEMADFVDGRDVTEQALLADTEKMLSPARSEVLRKLLKVAGVDTTPLDVLVNTKESLADDLTTQTAAIKEMAGEKIRQAMMDETLTRQAQELKRQAIVSDASNELKKIRKQIQGEEAAGKSDVKDILDKADKAIEELGAKDAIIPKQSDFQLQGKSTRQIRQEALKQLADNMKVAGITNPYGYVQVMLGTAQLFASSVWGLGRIALGASRIGPNEMVKTKWFQDWMVNESGVDAGHVEKFRQSVQNSGPALQQLSDSIAEGYHESYKAVRNASKASAAAAVTNKVTQIRIDPQRIPDAPKPQGNIRIAP